MIIPQFYFLDSATLGGATGVYMDSQLTICAPDGFYSDGVITREQSSCLLFPQQACESCSLPCDGPTITSNGVIGLHNININAGTNIGAILIRFNPFGIPDGIKAVFNSVVYNKLSSPIDGLHQSTNPSNYTFVGVSGLDCGLAGTTYPALPNFIYDGTTFVNQGTTSSVSVAAGDVSLSSVAPQQCMMVIPKNTSSSSVINILTVSPCLNATFDIEVSCAALLPTFASGEKATTSILACLQGLTLTYYFASLQGYYYVDIYDYVFSDANGQYPLEDGFYHTDRFFYDWIEVANGIVITIGSC
jgi:hypothetical protein